MGNTYINWREPGRLDTAKLYVDTLGWIAASNRLSLEWARPVSPEALESALKRHGRLATTSESAPPRIVTIDIETAPIVAYVWDIWDQNVSLDQIVEEWSILAFSAKWLGERKPIYHDTSGSGPGRVRDDKALLGKLWDILNEADIVVTQNGKKFDLRKIRTRMMIHGFKPFSPIRMVDTMLEAKKILGNTSNKLAWMSEHFTNNKKSAHKKFPGFDLWKECLADNPDAWAEMQKYNIQDVVTTEELYLLMLPWIEGHPNVANYMDGLRIRCPNCGSPQLVAEARPALTQSSEYTRYHCLGCGAWPRSRYTLNSTAKRKRLLTT